MSGAVSSGARRRAATALVAALLVGCGAAQVRREASSGAREEEEEGVASRVGDAALTIVPRASEGRSWVSLWIDAGARDAGPPPLATVTAWAVASRSGVEARVLPDGTELRASCESARIDACVGALAAALRARAVDDGALVAALARLRSARRGARSDAARRADRAALAALLGDLRGLDPLGDAEDEAQITRARAEAFLAAHWGPSRALFVVVGDADPAAARDAIASALAGAPRASGRRAERTLDLHVGGRAEIGDEARASVAIAVRDEPGRSGRSAIAIARRALAELAAGGEGGGASASVFAIRGADVVLVRGRDAAAVAGAMAYARALGPEGAGEALGDDDPRAIAARVGARWVARATERVEGGLGVGAVIDGGRGDVAAEDPEEARSRLDAEQRAADATLAEIARAADAGEAIEVERGDEDRASMRLAEGARAIAVREASGRVAIALSLEASAAGEPARVQGRGALLARLLARCAGEGSAGGASGWADARSIGVVVESTPAGAIDAIDRVTRCARALPLSPEAVESARARAISELVPDDARLARAASVIAPGAPGMIAPRGQDASIAAIDARGLASAWRWMATRGRARVAIVGEVSASGAARAAILGLARLPAGDAAGARGGERGASAREVGIAGEEIVGVVAEDGALEALLALRDPRPRGRGAQPGAQAALAALAPAIDGGGLRVVWARAGAGPEGAWLTLAMRGGEDAIAGAAARLAEARGAAEGALDGALATSLQRAREDRSREAATLRERARRLAWEQEGDAPDAEASAEAARALLRAEARWVIARPAVDAR